MLLYGSTESGHSFKIRSFLLLTATPHRYQWIDLSLARQQRPAAFIAASPFGEVPVLVHQGKVLCQSNAILSYFAQQSGQFTGGKEQQAALEWLAWEANRIGFSVPNYRFALHWSPQAPEVMTYLHARLLADLATLEDKLAGRDFLLASGPSIADISCSAYLFWLDQISIVETDWPNIKRWLSAIRQLPHWQSPNIAMQGI
ncbi:glutathione S-transferase family protein [Iodobacter sp.]|uniref:glutathione S-transferase family protein n=1 Tax=Iodobacter sp. TaxID=1915058 RepID=UPI0025CF3331|nr:glutathione S-transferase family protein [Iodobacter sp.]